MHPTDPGPDIARSIDTNPIPDSFVASQLLKGVTPIGYTLRPRSGETQPRPVEQLFDELEVTGVANTFLSWRNGRRDQPTLERAPRSLNINGQNITLEDRRTALSGGMATGLVGEYQKPEAGQSPHVFVRFIHVANRPQEVQIQFILRELSILDHIHALEGVRLFNNQSGQLTVCMVVKLVPGKDLRKVIDAIELRDRFHANRYLEKPRHVVPLSVEQGFDDALLMRDLCINLLADAHRGIMHRDTKPENIMAVSPDTENDDADSGQPRHDTRHTTRRHNRLIDYGIARAQTDRDIIPEGHAITDISFNDTSDTIPYSLTARNNIAGSPEYMTVKSMLGGLNIDPYVNLVGVFSGLFEKWQIMKRPDNRFGRLTEVLEAKREGQYFVMSRLDKILRPAGGEISLDMKYEDVAKALEKEFGEEFPHEAMRKLLFIGWRVLRIAVMYSDAGMPQAFPSTARSHESEYIGVVRTITQQVTACANELFAALPPQRQAPA